ncbi:MAG TPA: MFS transporter [Gaiellaceae bacterium]|nr:MFS transporter [Gaiellaceae bacterium]
MRSEARPARIDRAAWRLLAAALVSQVGVSVVEQGIPTLTGFIKDDLGLTAAAAGLTVSSFTVGRVVGSYAAGLAADRIGERRVLVGGGVATGLLVALAVSAPLPALVLLLALAGVASAASTPAGGRLVLLAFPRNRRGLALGLRQTGIPIGGLVAAVLLPWIAHLEGWRWSLAAGGAITVLTVAPLLVSRAQRWDEGEAAAAARRRSPARDRTIRLLTMWGCLVVTGQYALIAFLALDLHANARLTLAGASLAVACAQASGIVGRVAWGALSDRLLAYGRKPLLLALTAVALTAALLLLAIPRSAPLAVLAAVATVAGFALIGFQGLWVTMVAEAAGPARAGAATGFGITFIAGSIAISPPAYGLVADLAGTYRAVWAALALVLAIAFVPASLVGTERR